MALTPPFKISPKLLKDVSQLGGSPQFGFNPLERALSASVQAEDPDGICWLGTSKKSRYAVTPKTKTIITMNKFATMRSEKIKSLANLKEASNHNSRIKIPENASYDIHDNDRVKQLYMYKNSSNAYEAFEELQSDLNFTIGKNTVIAREFVCSFSPEMKGKFDFAEWKRDQVQFFKKHYGDDSTKGKLISLELHLDEKTPHIHAVVVPAVYKEYRKKMRWRLDEKTVHGGKTRKEAAQRLVTLQDKYAEAMAKHGLERGKRGSTAIHMTLKHHRGMEADIAEKIKEGTGPVMANLDKKNRIMQKLEKDKIFKETNMDRLKNWVSKLTSKVKKTLTERDQYQVKMLSWKEKYEALLRSTTAMKNELKAIKNEAGTTNVKDIISLIKTGLVARKENDKKLAESSILPEFVRFFDKKKNPENHNDMNPK